MARKLHNFRVWFQTLEGERINIPVQAMNIYVAVRKAQTQMAEDRSLSEIGGRKREWSPAFVQDEDAPEQGFQQVTLLQEQVVGGIPPVKSTPPKTATK